MEAGCPIGGDLDFRNEYIGPGFGREFVQYRIGNKVGLSPGVGCRNRGTWEEISALPNFAPRYSNGLNIPPGRFLRILGFGVIHLILRLLDT